MLNKKCLDASEMEPPEPFERATAILLHLQRGEYLRMAHRRIPWPLFDYARELSLEYRVQRGETTEYEILIWHREDTSLISGLFKGEAQCE